MIIGTKGYWPNQTDLTLKSCKFTSIFVFNVIEYKYLSIFWIIHVNTSARLQVSG